MDLIIRDVAPDDAAPIAAILNEIIEDGHYSVFDTKFSDEEEKAYIENMHPRGIFHVACIDDEIVGIQTIEPFALYTHAFDHVAQIGTFLKLNHRGKGIGTRLSEVTFERAKRMGYEKIFTYVREDNKDSLNFHLKLGFTVVGIASKQAKIHGKYINEILIEKFL